jgi:hypothetical protein|tara:strand:+ start:644 stop:877 length:234 start_codon:yes stop_codon:yes gene_type:complete
MRVTTDTVVDIENVSTGKVQEANVGMFKEGEMLETFIVGNRLILKYKKTADMYIGSLYGMEFQTKGPDVRTVKDWRS